jgi:putative ABC transport system permease protein
MKRSTVTRFLAGSWSALMLRAFPDSLREGYGCEMIDAYERELDAVGRASGRLGALRFSLRASLDFLRAGLGERRRQRRGRAGQGATTAATGSFPRRRAVSPGGPSLNSGGRGPLWSGWFSDIGLDVRLALRGLQRSKGFTAIAVFSLALGLGVNTALFTLFHATWMESVPGVNGADRIVELLSTGQGSEAQEWAYPDFLDVRSAYTPIDPLVGWKERDGSLTKDDSSERVRVTYVSPGYFQTLGVVPAQGRGFLPAEDVAPGQHPVAVVSHDLWQNRFGGDEDLVGTTVILNRIAHTVVGIAPEEFRGHRALHPGTDLWAPLMQHPLAADAERFLRERDMRWVNVLGRLRDGAGVDEANAALRTVFARLAEEYPDTHQERGARALPFGPIPAMGRSDSLLGTAALFVLVGLVLLIICGNVAGMVLARSATRGREIAVRVALGSGRWRLIRHLMIEALVLALAGGALGMLTAFWVTDAIRATSIGAELPAGVDFRPNGTILAFSLLTMLSTTLVIGLFPALRFSRPEIISSLKDASGGGGRRVGRVHRLAASAQAGVALALLVTCGLFVRSLGAMEQRDLGFESHDLLVTRIDVSQEGYETPEEAQIFLDRLKEAVSAVPGVASVSIADGIPLDLVGNFTGVSRADQAEGEGERVTVEFTRASEGYFRTIGTPVLRGRGFEPSDGPSSEPVVVITQSLAERLWPGEEALGRQARFPLVQAESRAYTVIGVVPNVASSTATRDIPHIFIARRQTFYPRSMVVIRGGTDTSTLARSIQTAILNVDPTLPIAEVISSESLVYRSTSGQRMIASTAGGFGLLALVLSAIGVYGVVAFAVANRTREIGLRMALGATRVGVLRGVLADAVRLAVPGLLVGALLAAVMAVIAQSELMGLSPTDPVSFGAAAAVLFLIVLLASLVPARRASKVDPMDALRYE